MGLFDFLKRKPAISIEAAQEMVMKSFNAAYYATNANSETMDFSFASDVGFNTALISDLNQIRNKVRSELRYNSIAKGMMRTYANSCVGLGPKLSIICEADQGWAEEAERCFAEWAKQCEYLRGNNLGSIIHLGVRQFFSSGEYLLVTKDDSTSKHPVKLKYLMVRPDRLDNPYDLKKDNIIGGIELNNDGKPLAYYINKSDPDITPYGRLTAVGEYDRVPSEQITHVFYQEDPAQVRGEPWLATALPDLHKLRRYDDATLAAATVAAKFAVMLVNLNEDIVNDYRQILPPGVMDIHDGMITVIPPGYDAKQMSPQHPAANNERFRKDVIGNAGSAAGMPKNIANNDSSDSNFASARFDGGNMTLEENVTRGVIETRQLNPMGNRVIHDAAQVGAIPPEPKGGYRLIWRWHADERHTDPLKAANAEKIRVQSGNATFARIASEHGQDAQESYKELLGEVEKFRKAGLRHPMDAKINLNDKGKDNVKTDTDTGK